LTALDVPAPKVACSGSSWT